MVTDTQGLATLLLPAFIFLFVFIGVAVLTRLAGHQRERARIRRQLRALSLHAPGAATATDQLFRPTARDRQSFMTSVADALPMLHGAEELAEQADLSWSSTRILSLSAVWGIGLGTLALVVSGSPLRTAMFLAFGASLPFLYLLRRRSKRMAAFEEQLPEAIDLLSRAIRAGHTVGTGLRLVAEESIPPISTEFRRVFEEQKYGLPFEESLLALGRRINLVDVRVMIVAIIVQREVGGNLAEILDKIAHLIRTRFTLRRQVRVYTAQGRMSGYVLGGLPIALAVILYLVNPEYVAMLFTDPAGKMMLMGAFGLQLIGYLWIWRILRLDF